MDFIENPFHFSLLTWPISLVLLGIVALILSHLFLPRRKRDTGVETFIVIGSIVSIIAGVVLGLAAGLAADSQRMDAIGAEAARVYGVSLDSNDIYDLDYPSNEPTSGIVSYGTAEGVTIRDGESYSKVDVQLLWDRDRMVLASSSDGEDFKPLTRQD